MTATERLQRTDAADALCSAAFARAVEDTGHGTRGTALVAVGGYGRCELAPHSDLDLVLVHADDVAVGEIASAVWYPLWDAGVKLDHAVRALSEVTAAARKDVRVALGLLDARHLAGDPSVTLRLRTTLLAQWRRDARAHVPALRELVVSRRERLGELAHATVPDLKDAVGGLRDATILKALVATWLVDVPHTELEHSRAALLDVRDAVHLANGRGSDRVPPETWVDVGSALGLSGEAAQRRTRELGRRIAHLSRLTWRRVEGALEPGTACHRRRPGPALSRLGHGLAATAGEVVLERSGTVTDLTLLLRAAVEAAERGLALSPHTAAQLAQACSPWPERWPGEARELFVRLLAAGPGLLPVWETLDETGALAVLLPEWRRVRMLPHASVVHRFTVDRHLVETCAEAGRLLPRVKRPDLLVVAALLHDIGKGQVGDHSAVGAPLAAEVACRLGFSAAEVGVVTSLVRHHLLLAEVATTRDIDDPATIEHVMARVPDRDLLELLAALTEADARATSAQAWTPWRRSLVRRLVDRVRTALAERRRDEPTPAAPEEPWEEVPAEVRDHPERVAVRVEDGHGCSCITVVATDRTGLLATVAAALTVQGAQVCTARAWTQESFAFSRWEVLARIEPAILRTHVEAALAGRTDPGARLRSRSAREPHPSVAVDAEASRSATVLEIRVRDSPGLVHTVCHALAGIRVSVRSAHVATVGPQAVDVFYLQEEGAGAMTDQRAAEAAHAVRDALTAPVTLDA